MGRKVFKQYRNGRNPIEPLKIESKRAKNESKGNGNHRITRSTLPEALYRKCGSLITGSPKAIENSQDYCFSSSIQCWRSFQLVLYKSQQLNQTQNYFSSQL